MDDVISLVQEVYAQNEFGGQEPTETKTDVWASIQTVTRAEWSSAGQAGLNPELTVTTAAVNYNGEKILEIQGKRYGIYRVYRSEDSDEIELYCEGKAGIKDEQKN